MKDYTGVILFLGITLIAVAAFWGIKFFIFQAFKPEPPIESSEPSIMRKQRNRMNDIRQRQKELMRNQKQRIRDMQRR